MNQQKCLEQCCSGEIFSFTHSFHIEDFDPATRRCGKPENMSDETFYDALMSNGAARMRLDADIAVCLFEQAYEVARDKKLGGTACLCAATAFCQYGFLDLAFKLLVEIAETASVQGDMETLSTAWAFLRDFGGFVREEAKEIARVLEEKHPEVRKLRDPRRLN